MTSMTKKAVALTSGGLDSTLAVKLMLEEGIEVHALNFTSVFCTCSGKKKEGCASNARIMAEKLKVPVKVVAKGLEYMEIVRKPKYGYGKGLNPCIDCRVYMFGAAKKYMEEIGASFIVTGEVLGQRPMSQHKAAMKIIEKESALEGLVLRPLCAKHLQPTRPELEGMVRREKLLAITGRTRKPQIALAEKLSIGGYPCPSGGCLLTDVIFSKKVADLLGHKEKLTMKDLQILKVGRHFRYGGVKIVVGKDEAQNMELKNLAQAADTVIEPRDFPGPVAVVSGGRVNGAVEMAGRLILKYSSSEKGEVKASSNGKTLILAIYEKAAEETVEKLRIC